jgi:hypothetical protein
MNMLREGIAEVSAATRAVSFPVNTGPSPISLPNLLPKGTGMTRKHILSRLLQSSSGSSGLYDLSV